MNDKETLVVLKITQSYLSSSKGRGFNTANPSHIADFLDVVEKIWKKLADLEDPDCVPGPADIEQFLNGQDCRDPLNGSQRLELRMVALMCLLGPESCRFQPTDPEEPECGVAFGYIGVRTIPPESMRKELLGRVMHAGDSDNERIERLLEVVVAYGAGSWRVVDGGYPWRSRWPGAVLVIAEWIKGPLKDIDRWFRNISVPFYKDEAPAPNTLDWEDMIRSQAGLLVAIFCKPEIEIMIPANQSFQIGDTSGLSPPTLATGRLRMDTWTVSLFFFSSRRRHTRSCLVSWARRCV